MSGSYASASASISTFLGSAARRTSPTKESVKSRRTSKPRPVTIRRKHVRADPRQLIVVRNLHEYFGQRGGHIDRSVFITRFERRISSIEDLFTRDVGHRDRILLIVRAGRRCALSRALSDCDHCMPRKNLRAGWPSLCSSGGHCPVGTGTVPKLHALFLIYWHLPVPLILSSHLTKIMKKKKRRINKENIKRGLHIFDEILRGFPPPQEVTHLLLSSAYVTTSGCFSRLLLAQTRFLLCPRPRFCSLSPSSPNSCYAAM